MRFTIGKRPKGIGDTGLSRESARATLLAMLHGKALAVAQQVNNPAPSEYKNDLEELLDLLLLRLQVNGVSEHIQAAKVQLEGICSQAERMHKPFDAAIANLYERSDAQVNIQIVAASEHAEDIACLKRIDKLASKGGVFKRLARDGIALSTLLASGDTARLDGGKYTALSARAQIIVEERNRLSSGCLDDKPLAMSRSWNTNKKELEAELSLIGRYESAGTSAKKRELLVAMMTSPSHHLAEFLVTVVLAEKEGYEERELAACILEEFAPHIPMYEANEIARKLLARLTAYSVGTRVAPGELFLLLRVFGSVGDIEGGQVIAQFLEDDAIRGRICGTEFEAGILFQLIELLKRGGDAAQCLYGLITDEIKVSLVGDSLNQLKSQAALALSRQKFGISKLLELFTAIEVQPELVRRQIESGLAQDDSAQKVIALVELGEEIVKDLSGAACSKLTHIMGALRNTHHPEGQRFLYSLLSSNKFDDAIKQAAAFSLRAARGAVLMRMIDDLASAQGEQRGQLLTALSGNPEEARFGMLVRELSHPFDAERGQEEYRLVALGARWGVV